MLPTTQNNTPDNRQMRRFFVIASQRFRVFGYERCALYSTQTIWNNPGGQKMKMKLAILAAGAVLASSVALFAHHAFQAEYDAKKPIKITGTVKKVEWTNPHIWFYVDV